MQDSDFKSQWILLGSALGAALPVGLGVYIMLEQIALARELARGEGMCGMPMFGSYALMFVGGPVCGAIGAVMGWIATINAAKP